MSTLLVDSGYPSLPFFVVDLGIEANQSVTIASGASVLEAGTILRLSGSGKYQRLAVSTSTATGILFRRTDPTDGDVIAPMFVMGVVRSGSPGLNDVAANSGLIDDAIADLPHILFV